MRLIDADALLASTDKEEIHKYEIALFPTIEPKKVVEDYCRPRNLMVVAAEDFHRFDVPDRKVGKWKHDADGLVWCYECGFGKERSDERPYHYCPNCGARMEEE